MERPNRAWKGTLLLLLTVGCARNEPPAEPAPQMDPARAALTATYSLEHLGAGRVQLEGGAYEDAAAGITSKIQTTRTGDFDGDGQQDAAVVLATQSGGSGTFVDLYAVLGRASGPVTRGPASLGDRVRVDSLSVGERVITVHLLEHAPQDPLCCPTRRAVQHYVLVGDTLARRPQELP